MILFFREYNSLEESIKLLKQYKFENYKQKFLVFNDQLKNDYVSPIFNME